ncbi:glycosyltransferase family 2 protein [Metabacillus halosaccharovorans]|uniref:glycosyltransferase family 2 protein n=1 Tax=Metabacillus halosaccharovorans TaxID=930124 RepID=UPI003734D773
MPKVSIIIPAYNIENYITRCLDSVLNQTFEDIEIIVVNDGSKDLTLEKVKYKAERDNRIKIIDKKNEGSIEARKDGFEQASGEYILFVDGDDYIDNRAIGILYNKSIEETNDIVCFNYSTNSNGKIINKKNKYLHLNLNLKSEYGLLKSLLLNQIVPSLGCKFIKKSFILNNNIPFPGNISFAEDLAFSCSLAMYNPSVSLIDENLYYYYIREDSITKLLSPKILDTIKAFNFIKEEMVNKNLIEKYAEEYEFLAYIHNYYYRRDYIFGYKDKLCKTIFNEWRKMDIYIYNNKYYHEFIESLTFKERILLKLFERVYLTGKLYYKLKIN